MAIISENYTILSFASLRPRRPLKRTFQGENTFGWITPAPGAMKRAEQARDYSQGWDGSQENRTRKLREKFRKE
jgi:hypothetical protein